MDTVTKCGPNGCTTRKIDDDEWAWRMSSAREQLENYLLQREVIRVLEQSEEALQRQVRALSADNEYLRESLIQCRRAQVGL
jgi:hypothetical protein